MLSELSQRYVTLPRLVQRSGLRRREVRTFVEMLELRGLLSQRDAKAAACLFDPLRPLASWLRRAFALLGRR